jgi:hypothetical protein
MTFRIKRTAKRATRASVLAEGKQRKLLDALRV